LEGAVKEESREKRERKKERRKEGTSATGQHYFSKKGKKGKEEEKKRKERKEERRKKKATKNHSTGFFFFLIRMQSDEPIMERPSRSCKGRSRSAGEVGGVSAGGLATQGCARACWAVILFDGSVVSSLEMKSFAGGINMKGG